MLHKDKALENFKKVHDIFSRRLCFEMKGSPHHKFSPKSLKLVQTYSSIYIQYPRFTYLRIGGFDDEPI